ncbi:MAG TPA: RNA polymerase subunit sigma-70, partial [Candidatus Desulfofervidus auxilii]|nr:RNA polymerase subunit sigma-70 [Candidatus Desulfofervidus auxilii]
TLKEIGKRHHVSRERIRQIEARLIEKLRNYLKEEFPDYQEALTTRF